MQPGNYGPGQDPYSQPQPPYGGGQDPYSQPQPPYSGGQDPYAQPQPPYSGGQDPYGQQAPQAPYSGGQDPYAQPQYPVSGMPGPVSGMPGPVSGMPGPSPYGVPPQAPGYQVPGFGGYPAPPNNTPGLVGMILGILSLVPGLCCSWLGVPLGIAAIVLGVIGMKKANEGGATNKGQALAGLICGGSALVLTVLMLAFSFTASALLDS